MHRRKVLVIHESHTMRRILAKSIESELSDCDVYEATSPGEGIERLHEDAFHVVVCGNEMTDIDGPGVHAAMRSGRTNKTTPFLLVTASPNRDNLDHLHAAGIKHILSMSSGGHELARRIDSVCDPRQSRKHERLVIPGTTAEIHGPTSNFPAETANLGAGGVLCDITYREDFAGLLTAETMTLHFPDNYPVESLTVPVRFLRMSITKWQDQETPRTIRMAWSFRDMSDDTQHQLHEVIATAMRNLDPDW